MTGKHSFVELPSKAAALSAQCLPPERHDEVCVLVFFNDEDEPPVAHIHYSIECTKVFTTAVLFLQAKGL